MRLATFMIAAGTATGALAHPGHLEQVSGHDHWELLGGIAILAAIGAAAVWSWRRT